MTIAHCYKKKRLNMNEIKNTKYKAQYELMKLSKNREMWCTVFCTKWWLSRDGAAACLTHIQMFPMSGTYYSQQHGDIWRLSQHGNNFKLYRNCYTVSCMQCRSRVDRSHKLWQWSLVKSVTLCCTYMNVPDCWSYTAASGLALLVQMLCGSL